MALVMAPLTQNHPYYTLLVNFRTHMREKKEFDLQWVRSYCLWKNSRYHSVLKTTLQVALAEQLILFGKNPVDILKFEYSGDEKMLRLPKDVLHKIERRFINFLLSEYNKILFLEKAAEQKEPVEYKGPYQ